MVRVITAKAFRVNHGGRNFNCELCQKISHCGCSERETLDNVDINECVEKYKKYMLAETER